MSPARCSHPEPEEPDLAKFLTSTKLAAERMMVGVERGIAPGHRKIMISWLLSMIE